MTSAVESHFVGSLISALKTYIFRHCKYVPVAHLHVSCVNELSISQTSGAVGAHLAGAWGTHFQSGFPFMSTVSTARGPGGRVLACLEISLRCDAVLMKWIAMETTVVTQSASLTENSELGQNGIRRQKPHTSPHFHTSLALGAFKDELARRGHMTLWIPGLSVQLASTPALKRPADSSSHSVCKAVHTAVCYGGRLHSARRHSKDGMCVCGGRARVYRQK